MDDGLLKGLFVGTIFVILLFVILLSAGAGYVAYRLAHIKTITRLETLEKVCRSLE